MVSLLIISHSAHIARGVKELADQMVQGRVAIAATGGTLEGDLGTSPDMIVQALDTVRSSDGVLVLVDLGSALMSAEMALENSGLPYIISHAPIVEGALVAAVQASAGAGLEQIAAAADRALEAKGPPAERAAPPPPEAPPAAPQTPEAILTVDHPAGLHMRPATLFVRTAADFTSRLRVRNLDRPDRPAVDAKSMIGVMKLGVSQGHRIHVTAEGDDAQAALDALARLVAGGFVEPA